MSKALDWLRNNEAKAGGLDDAFVVSTYCRVSGMPGGKLDPTEKEIRHLLLTSFEPITSLSLIWTFR
jgi:hypothetical protein